LSDNTKSFRLDLEVGDYVVWQDDEIRLGDADGSVKLIISPGMVGKVVKTGFDLDEAWALAEFENGKQIMLRPKTKFEKVKVQ
jgi:hypothetical protein